MNKKFFTFILAATGLVLLSSILIPRFNNSETDAPPITTPSEPKSILFVLDYGENNITTYNLEINEDATVFSLLENITDKENISLETKQYDFGVFIESIGGKKSSSDAAWIYFVNGESGQIAADQQKINPGDVVEWKYIAPSE